MNAFISNLGLLINATLVATLRKNCPAVYQLYGWGQRPSICWFGEPDGKKRISFPGRSIYLKRV